MTTPTIHQLALRCAADAVTASLEGEMPTELKDEPPRVREEYRRAVKGIAAGLYRRVSEMGACVARSAGPSHRMIYAGRSMTVSGGSRSVPWITSSTSASRAAVV